MSDDHDSALRRTDNQQSTLLATVVAPPSKYDRSMTLATVIRPYAKLLFLALLLHPLNGLFSRTAWVSWYQKGKTSLHLNEARNDKVGISWTICKQSAANHTNTPSLSVLQAVCLTAHQRIYLQME